MAAGRKSGEAQCLNSPRVVLKNCTGIWLVVVYFNSDRNSTQSNVT